MSDLKDLYLAQIVDELRRANNRAEALQREEDLELYGDLYEEDDDEDDAVENAGEGLSTSAQVSAQKKNAGDSNPFLRWVRGLFK